MFTVSSAQGAPYEPNDSFLQAVGPLSGGVNYDGAVETSNDVDYFFFNVNGQRQFDVSAVTLGGCGSGYVELHDANDDHIGHAYFNTAPDHILYTAPFAFQYTLWVHAEQGCKYRLKVDPADAITTVPPGMVVSIRKTGSIDDIQRLYVDGQLHTTVAGTDEKTISLGALAPTARITLEAQNVTGGWAWDVLATNQTDRTPVTILSEKQSGDSERIGIVRRMTFTPSGGLIDSCGEALAPLSCIPVDIDGDGSIAGSDCNDLDPSIKPGATEIRGNRIDEDCDGVILSRTPACLKARKAMKKAKSAYSRARRHGSRRARARAYKKLSKTKLAVIKKC